MKESDVVKLLSDYEGVLKGTEGTVVLDYDEETCEVEFFDTDGNTIDVVTTPKNLLEVVCVYSETE